MTEIIWMPVQGGVKFHDLSSWYQRMAVSETLAHLKSRKLKAEYRYLPGMVLSTIGITGRLAMVKSN
ncbi:MAG: hypothetical protein QGI51_01965 [Dehalococcoidales bacterium]|jgi:hypothetical protein|nr:hypothetical protein [Dehalococcoidales bacterium]MDP6632254.1 hypothetical protein [Dehalococcoidales bacterium]|tara:strand:- start:29 stop:229 length:201 start_codon:yes stop_codon:yes gene_type:complete